jgi:hypothetical protein
MLIVLAMLVVMQGLGGRVIAAGAEDTAQSALDLVRSSSLARAPGVGRSVGSRGSESDRIELLERIRGHDVPPRAAAEDREDLVLRLMLFRAVAERRGLR